MITLTFSANTTDELLSQLEDMVRKLKPSRNSVDELRSRFQEITGKRKRLTNAEREAIINGEETEETILLKSLSDELEPEFESTF